MAVHIRPTYAEQMMRRMLTVTGTVTVLLAAACSSLDGYPGEWHSATDSVRVYVADRTRVTALPISDQPMTLLDAVFALGDTGADLSRITVFRRSGSETMTLEVDVREMVRTGATEKNILLQPGDVVGIAG